MIKIFNKVSVTIFFSDGSELNNVNMAVPSIIHTD